MQKVGFGQLFFVNVRAIALIDFTDLQHKKPIICYQKINVTTQVL